MVDDTNSTQKPTVSSDQANYNPTSGSMVKEVERPTIVSGPTEVKAQPEIPQDLEAELEKAKESVVAKPLSKQQGIIKTPKEEVLPPQEPSEIADSMKRLQQIERREKTGNISDSVYWLRELLKKILKQFGLKG